MLRGESTRNQLFLAWALVALVGAGAAWLVARGNPGNMGICGACFLRDTAGSLGLVGGAGPKIFRPELLGILLGAFAWRAGRWRFHARSGSHAVARFLLGVAMAFGALVFLGCPFRMLQRMGGGDATAWIGLFGFVAGVGAGRLLEARGYSAGKTHPAPAPVGLLGIGVWILLFALFLSGGVLLGPAPFDESSPPPHAPLGWTLGVGAAAGAALSMTGFCAVAAARGLFGGPWRMTVAAAALVAGYAAVAAATGRFRWGLDGQPVAHADALWNVLALAWVGLCGVLAGGCPVRQVVMAGEGNGDAFVCVAGMLVGGGLAHNLGLVSGPEGPTAAGAWTVAIGLAGTVVYGAAVAIGRKPDPA